MVNETQDHSPNTTGAMKNKGKLIHVEDIDIAIKMLTTYVDSQAIDPLVAALEMLKTDTKNQAYQSQVVDAFNALGVMQGAALTYAPYLNVFVSDDPFGDD